MWLGVFGTTGSNEQEIKYWPGRRQQGPERVLVRFPWNDTCRNAAKHKEVQRSKYLTNVGPDVVVANIEIRGAVCVAQAGRNH